MIAVGALVEISDRKRPWADGEIGRVIGVWPWQGAPERYEVVVVGRQLTCLPENLTLFDEQANLFGDAR
jgi:hypothetical protein